MQARTSECGDNPFEVEQLVFNQYPRVLVRWNQKEFSMATPYTASNPTPDTLIAKAIYQSVQPAVTEVATRLIYLTEHREGSEKFKAKNANIYETTFVQSIFEHLLMTPLIAHMEVRHEYGYPKSKTNERVDLWIRHPKGGIAHFIEVGFFDVKKVHCDFEKMARLAPTDAHWMLAFFLKEDWKSYQSPAEKVVKVLDRTATNGHLDAHSMTFNKLHSGCFQIYRPGAAPIDFGYALFKGR